MILTEGKWQKKSWACMGVGLSEHYVALWFGQRPDSKGKPRLCKKQTHHNVQQGPKTKQSTKVPTYYLVLGTYKSMKNANEALRRFRKNGFSKAGILRKNHKIRIYADRYKGFKAALKAKQRLPFSYRDAWILEQ
jgi:ribosomal protein S21